MIRSERLLFWVWLTAQATLVVVQVAVLWKLMETADRLQPPPPAPPPPERMSGQQALEEFHRRRAEIFIEKERMAWQLVEGHITFAQAADRFRDLLENEGGMRGPATDSLIPSEGPRERAARLVLYWVKPLASKRKGGVERLEKEAEDYRRGIQSE